MFVFRFRSAMSRRFCTSAGSMSAMNRSVSGGTDWARCLLPRFGEIASTGCERTPIGSGHLDEVFVKINGELHYLGRAVDHEGEVVESFVTKRRDRKAALKLIRKSMKRYGQPHIIVTDRLRSYGAAMKLIGNSGKQETGRWQNNRAENSHLPFRRRERAMQRFHRMRCLQKFAAVHSSVHSHFNLERHLCSRASFKLNRTAALAKRRQLGLA